jgi:hypothetical protein
MLAGQGNGRDAKVHTKWWLETLNVRNCLAKPRERGEDNIKLDLIKIGCEHFDWFHLV